METKKYLLILLSLIATSTSGLLAQGESMDQITTFSSRLKNPIDVEMRTDQGNIYLNVQNYSYYPYNFEVKFGALSNVSPQIYNRTAKIFPGKTRLLSFKIVDESQPPIVNYQISYSLAGSISSEEKYNPYLIPIGENKTVQFLTEKKENSTKLFLNQYIMDLGDTIFCSRKGIVTALPDIIQEIDRIMDNNSLEVLHDDGTVAIYQGLSSGSKLIKLGQKVYPGQPIGIMGTSKLLKFLVLELQYDSRIKALNILYSGADDQMILPQKLNGQKVFYSAKVITQELSKKEISKYKNRTLY